MNRSRMVSLRSFSGMKSMPCCSIVAAPLFCVLSTKVESSGIWLIGPPLELCTPLVAVFRHYKSDGGMSRYLPSPSARDVPSVDASPRGRGVIHDRRGVDDGRGEPANSSGVGGKESAHSSPKSWRAASLRPRRRQASERDRQTASKYGVESSRNQHS